MSLTTLRRLSGDYNAGLTEPISQNGSENDEQINALAGKISHLISERNSQDAIISQLKQENVSMAIKVVLNFFLLTIFIVNQSLINSKYQELLAQHTRLEKKSVNLLKTKELALKQELDGHM